MSTKRRVALLGCGYLGQFLAGKIIEHPSLELVSVWDRDAERKTELLEKYPQTIFTLDIEEVISLKPDIVVEVAHPDVSRKYGEVILKRCDYMMGSPAALADEELYNKLTRAATKHSVYIPSGAFWGGEDIRKMSDLGSLEALKITMKFHPGSLKLSGRLKEISDQATQETVLYQGAVRGVCKEAPNNSNSMAAASIAATNLGFDGVQACLVCDPLLAEVHIVEIEVWGKKLPSGGQFHVHTVRTNPAFPGQVTGTATLNAFFGSLLKAQQKGPGIHLS